MPQPVAPWQVRMPAQVVPNGVMIEQLSIMPMLAALQSQGVDAMAGKNARMRPALGLVKVAQAVDQYGGYFDHPGFEPIRHVR